jgi:hypothetical protein
VGVPLVLAESVGEGEAVVVAVAEGCRVAVPLPLGVALAEALLLPVLGSVAVGLAEGEALAVRVPVTLRVVDGENKPLLVVHHQGSYSLKGAFMPHGVWFLSWFCLQLFDRCLGALFSAGMGGLAVG